MLCGALLQRQHRFGKLVADPDKQAHRGQVVQKEENERLLKVEKDKLRLQKQIGGDGTVEKGVGPYRAASAPAACSTLRRVGEGLHSRPAMAIMLRQWMPRCSESSTKPQ